MPISILPLMLRCTGNMAGVAIIENGESAFERNIRVKVKIGLSLLIQPGITLQLDVGFIGGSSSRQIIDNTVVIEDVENKDVIHCEKKILVFLHINNPTEELIKNQKRKAIKKKSKSKFADVIVEGESSLWLESDVDVVSVADDTK